MVPENHPSTAVDPGIHHWNSPLPYLFGGLAVMLGLIALALIILACSYKKSSSEEQSNDDDVEQKPAKPAAVLQPEMEPRIVVIMAGEHNPTFLAKPSASLTRQIEEV